MKTEEASSTFILVLNSSYLAVENGGTTNQFKCAFMEHDAERLQIIDANALKMSVEQVRKFSPNSLSIMEFKNQTDIDITTKVYGDWPLIGEKLNDNWNIKFNAELHMTNDSHLFKDPNDVTNIHEYYWLWEGKQFWLLSDGFAEPTRLVARKDITQLVSARNIGVAYRTHCANTNERRWWQQINAACPPAGNFNQCLPSRAWKMLFLGWYHGNFCG